MSSLNCEVKEDEEDSATLAMFGLEVSTTFVKCRLKKK